MRQDRCPVLPTFSGRRQGRASLRHRSQVGDCRVTFSNPFELAARPSKALNFPEFFRLTEDLEAGLIDLSKGDSKEGFGVSTLTPTARSEANVVTSRHMVNGTVTD